MRNLRFDICGGKMKENAYQAVIIRRLNQLFPGCLILKNDPAYLQGVPDLIILFGSRWAALEVKVSHMAPCRPNQEYYISRLSEMSFASFIYPENEERVLNELKFAFSSEQQTCSAFPFELSLD